MKKSSLSQTILSDEYLGRLHTLLDRLAQSVHKLEIIRTSPVGQIAIPEPESQRPYTPGDDPRYIDWNLYARFNRYYVKSMMREEQGLVHILVDRSASMTNPYGQKLLRAQETAAALAFLAVAAGNKVRLYTWAEDLSVLGGPFWSRGQLPEMLKKLAELPSGGMTDLDRSLKEVIAGQDAKESWSIIISDFLTDPSFIGPLRLLASLGLRTSGIQILHPQETRKRGKGNIIFIDPETGSRARRVFGYRALRDLRRATKDFLEETRGSFRLPNTQLLQVSTEETFEDIVVKCLAFRKEKG